MNCAHKGYAVVRTKMARYNPEENEPEFQRCCKKLDWPVLVHGGRQKWQCKMFLFRIPQENSSEEWTVGVQ